MSEMLRESRQLLSRASQSERDLLSTAMPFIWNKSVKINLTGLGMIISQCIHFLNRELQQVGLILG